jgi:hypothetical protein
MYGGYRSNDSNISPDTENYESNISPNAIRLDLEEGGANYDEDTNATSSQQHSRRRNIVTILSLIPLLGALIALGILMTNQTSSSSLDTTAIDNGSSSYVMSSNVTDTITVWDADSSEVETITFTSSGVKQKEDILDASVLAVDIIDEIATANMQPTMSPSNEVRFCCLLLQHIMI